MAAAAFPEGRSREEFVDEFLTCSICAEPYDSGIHQAKCLPCLHTYCESCLKGIAGKRSQLECPNCRKLIRLPGETVESLPNNFLVENLREYQNIFTLQVHCGNCDEENPAVRFCHDCGVFFCQVCTEGHQKIRSILHHQIVTMEELQAQKCNPMMQQQPHCKKHPKQDLNMYCKNKGCNIPVCASCGLVDHKTHDLVHLDGAIDDIVNGIRQCSETLGSRCTELSKMSAKIEATKKPLAANYASKRKKIKEFEQELIGVIKAQCDNASDHMTTLYEAECSKLDSNKECLDLLIAQMHSACEFANRSCDMSHTTQLLTSQKQIMDRLKELQVAVIPDIGTDKTDFVFTGKHHSALIDIQESLKDLCSVCWKPDIEPQQCTIRFNLLSEKDCGMKAAKIQTVDSNGLRVTTSGAEIEVVQEQNRNMG